ncbi:MAG TPA: translation initiation factor IF-6 [Thermoplasmata archaeon]|nr:translation initiation factor IF-6 [Thermoplasmata archaeon]
MVIGRTLIEGSPYLGVYLRAGESHVVAAPSIPSAIVRELERQLVVRAVRTTVAGMEIAGAMSVMNSRGVIVSADTDDDEIDVLRSIAPVLRLRSRYNAVGNNILANDHGAVVHPEFTDDAVAKISAALHVPAHRGTIAGLGTVAMAAVATNKGAVIHPRATPKEAELVQEVLAVPVHRSTANFGVPIVGACLVANSKAFVVGRPTTPVEIVHLQEGLDIFD